MKHTLTYCMFMYTFKISVIKLLMLTNVGLEIATHWLQVHPKIESWRLDFQNWSTSGESIFVQ